MSIEVQRLDGATVVRLQGEIDLDRSPQVRRSLLAAVHDVPVVIVDLAAVGYIDSSGVACLVEAYRLAQDRGVEFVLRDPSPAVRKVLRMARLDQVFPIRDAS